MVRIAARLQASLRSKQEPVAATAARGLFQKIAAPAQAIERPHVSAAFGSDANMATNRTAAPCRFFPAALTVNDNNGEVVVLDIGGYGALTIKRSFALIAPTGMYVGIFLSPNANGVAAGTITIANLADTTLDGNGYGLYVSSGGSNAVAKA